MSRPKGDVTPRIIDGFHPHQAQISMPGTGLGRSLDTMLAWSRGRYWRTRPFSASAYKFATAQSARETGRGRKCESPRHADAR